MSYIGIQSQNQVSPQFSREVINGDGSATSFTLIQDVPGFTADNIMVVVNNVIQEPVAAYTITEDANGNPRVLDFGSGNVLSTTDDCYVQHRGVGTLNMTPAANSVNAAALQDNLKSGNVDSFTGAGDTSGDGNSKFTLSETPLNAQCISVFVNGVYQKPSTNYTVSGTTLTFTGTTSGSDEIDVHHHTIRTTVTHVADGSVTSGKLDTNIQVAGTLGVTGASTLTGNTTVGGTLGVTGNTTLSGTITGGASTDIAINTNKFTVAAASGNTVIAGNLTVSGTTTIADNTIDSEHYTDGSIDTVHIADNQVTLAKMASGTDGQIITYDASGDPVAVGPGSDGQVLTSTGAGSPPAFEAIPASNNLVMSTSVTSMATGGVEFTGLNAGAKLFIISMHELSYGSGAGVGGVQLSTSSTYKTSGYNGGWGYYTSSAQGVNNEGAYIPIPNIGQSSFGGILWISRLADNDDYWAYSVQTRGGGHLMNGSGSVEMGGNIDKLRIGLASGAFLAAGKVTVNQIIAI